ncbi:MAG: uridine kinase [Bacteroidota bacterium]
MKSPFLIGITGGSGSGKTRFLKGLLSQFDESEVCLVSQDNYYKKRSDQPVDGKGIKNFDLPDSIDFDEYKKDIIALKEGKTVSREEYTFNNPDSNPKHIVLNPAPVMVVEGIFVFYYKEIADLLDLKVFIDAKDYIKLKRRIIRDDKERGYDLDDVLYRYENHVMPTYEKYIEPYKSSADLIIPNHTDFEEALEVLSAFIRSKV